MSKAEKEIEKPDEIVRVVKMILDFNKNRQQKGQGIKILTLTKCLIDYQLLQLNDKQEIIQTNLKMKKDNYYIHFIIDQYKSLISII